MGAPNYSMNTDNHPVSNLKQIILEQQDELVKLCTLVEYLRSFLHIGIDAGDILKYEEKLERFKELQQQRFNRIDDLINTNILQMKKQQTNDQIVLIFGKEIRKLEASLRTLFLFTSDIVSMLKQDSLVNHRGKERIRYFDTRSASLDVELRLLLQKMAFI